MLISLNKGSTIVFQICFFLFLLYLFQNLSFDARLIHDYYGLKIIYVSYFAYLSVYYNMQILIKIVIFI